MFSSVRTVGLQTPQISNAALFPVAPVTRPQDRRRARRKSASIKPGAQKNLRWFQKELFPCEITAFAFNPFKV